MSTKNKNDQEEVLSDAEIHNALSDAKPPQQFGFSVYPTGTGIAMRGNARLHPQHMATVDLKSKSLPVIEVTGTAFRINMNALLDTASADSWMEYDTAQKFKAAFLGLDGRNIPYRGLSYIGQASGYAAAVPQMRIDQLFIESVPLFVRMAKGSLGPLARGIQDTKIEGTLGYDILQNFEYVHFDFRRGKVSFSATTPYTPSETQLVGTAKIVNMPGVGLVVAGSIDGAESPILLDFAGDYNFARSDKNTQSTRQIGLGEVVYINQPTIIDSSMDNLPRAGLVMLKKYVVTICPRSGIVYFERPDK